MSPVRYLPIIINEIVLCLLTIALSFRPLPQIDFAFLCCGMLLSKGMLDPNTKGQQNWSFQILKSFDLSDQKKGC